MPSIIKKTYCERCGKEVSFIKREKTADGYLCKSCKEFLQPFVAVRDITIDQLTVETIGEIDEEVRKLEELAKQKSKENTKKVLIYSAIGFLLLLAIGAVSSATNKKDEDYAASEETTVEKSEDHTVSENSEEQKESAVKESIPAFSEEAPFHLIIKQMPTNLEKNVSNLVHTLRFDDENYMQIISHLQLIPYVSTFEENVMTECSIIQEQDGITINDGDFSPTNQAQYIYKGEIIIDGKQYFVKGYLYGTVIGFDEIRIITEDNFDDSIYKETVEKIIKSTSINPDYVMKENPPVHKTLFDGLNDMQSYFVQIYDLNEEDEIRALAFEYGFSIHEVVSDETFYKWWTMSREPLSDDSDSSLNQVERVVIYMSDKGKPHQIQYTNGLSGDELVTINYSVYGDKQPIEEVLNDVIMKVNK